MGCRWNNWQYGVDNRHDVTYIIGMAHTTTPTRTFTPGTTVTTGPGDYTWTFEVVARTKCFVTLRNTTDGKDHRVRIQTSDWSGETSEYALPFGSFSMAPLVRA